MARVAVVTGGTRGIGEAISKALKAAGYKVAATYAGNDEAANKFKAETGINVYKFDVSDYDACAAGIAAIEKELGPVEVLVNNAGITKDRLFHKMDLAQWNAVINTNLNSLFNVTRPVINGMRDRGFGRIIVISSINGQKGQAGQTNYSASKAGDIGFVKALAQESASKGITVNAIAPGYIATEMVKAVPQDVLDKHIIPFIAVGRLGEPEEIARAVVFLAADDAGFITGSTLTINGGQYLSVRSDARREITPAAGDSRRIFLRPLKRQIEHPRRRQRALDDLAEGHGNAAAGRIDHAARGRVAAAQDQRAAAPQARRRVAVDDDAGQFRQPRFDRLQRLGGAALASISSNVKPSCSTNGPTRVRRSAVTWPKQPSTRPRSRAMART